MKPSLLLSFGLSLFGAGAGVGWIAATRSGGNERQQVSAEEAPAPLRRRAAEPVNPRRAELKTLAADPERLEREIEDLPDGDLPALIDLLSARAGIEGLAWEERSKVGSMVKRLYEASPGETLAWIHGATHEGNRKFFFEAVLEAAAAKDAMQALELAERFRTETGVVISLPHQLCQVMAEQGPDSLVRTLALGVDKSGGASGSTMDFPAGFDFARMAEGLTDAASRMAEGEQFTFMPTNFIEEWARRDPQAAYEWALAADSNGTKDCIPFVGGLSGFFDGYAKVADPGEYGRFAAEVMMTGDLTEQAWRNAFNALSDNQDSVAIDAFLSEASSRRDSGEIIRGLLDISKNYTGGTYDRFRNRLFHRLPEEQRAVYLRDAPETVRRKLSPDAAD